jgi:hypothetical protein
MMAWIYGMASGVRASNKTSNFIPLLRNIMMSLAQALQVLPIPKQFSITLMRLYVINNRCRYDSSSLLAHLAQWLVPELPRSQR